MTTATAPAVRKIANVIDPVTDQGRIATDYQFAE